MGAVSSLHRLRSKDLSIVFSCTSNSECILMVHSVRLLWVIVLSCFRSHGCWLIHDGDMSFVLLLYMLQNANALLKCENLFWRWFHGKRGMPPFVKGICNTHIN